MKKIILPFLGLLIALSAQAQNGGFVLKGNILGSTADKVYLKYHTYGTYENHGAGTNFADSTIVVNGKFTFIGKVHEPAYAQLMTVDHSFGCQFWLENSDISIKGITEKTAELTGSATQDLMDKNDQALKPLQVAFQRKKAEYDKAKGNLDEVEAKRLEAEMDDISGRQFHAVTEKVIQENPNNYYSLNEVWNLAVMEKYSYDNLSRVFGYLSDSLKQTNLGQLVASQLAVLKKTSAGQEFPEYSQPDMDGNIVKVSDYRGKYLLLTFTSVGIEKEKQATGIKQTLYAKYHDAGLELMDVMFEDAKAKEKVKEYISGNHLAWKVVSDFKGWNNFAMRAFSIENIPCIFLINPDGVIIASRIKLTDVAPTIEGAFNK